MVNSIVGQISTFINDFDQYGMKEAANIAGKKVVKAIANMPPCQKEFALKVAGCAIAVGIIGHALFGLSLGTVCLVVGGVTAYKYFKPSILQKVESSFHKRMNQFLKIYES
jgi:hypothetical protein